MANDRKQHVDFEFTGEEEERSLIGADTGCGTDEELFYDEDGSMILASSPLGVSFAPREPSVQPLQPLQPLLPIPILRPCPSSSLNGSWYLQFTPQGPHLPSEIRGPMRIEVGGGRIRISGDVYVKPFRFPFPGVLAPIGTPITASPLIIRGNCIRTFPSTSTAGTSAAPGFPTRADGCSSSSCATSGTRRARSSSAPTTAGWSSAARPTSSPSRVCRGRR